MALKLFKNRKTYNPQVQNPQTFRGKDQQIAGEYDNSCHGPSRNIILQHQSTAFCKTGCASLFSVHSIIFYRW